MQIQIAIEFFQFLAIAPIFQSLEIVIKTASNVFMLDLLKVTSTSKQNYWPMLSTVCALCYIWFILIILIMTNAETWLKKVPLCQRFLRLMNSVFLPFFGNTMFIPALAILLDVYICDYQYLTISYVFRDCYMDC